MRNPKTHTILNLMSMTEDVKLPKLEEVLTFSEAFDATVDRGKSLSDIWKFTYLKDFLTGTMEKH